MKQNQKNTMEIIKKNGKNELEKVTEIFLKKKKRHKKNMY